MLMKPDPAIMAELGGTLSPEPSDDEDCPRYTPEELAEFFLDFYTFLTTLHYDKADLKVPPPEGWPGFTPELCAGFKSDYALEILRHLPYLNSRAAIHYKSGLVDYTVFDREYFERGEWREENIDFESSEGEVDPSHAFFIAFGRESNGVDLLLDTLHGEILVNFIRCGSGGSHDVPTFFGDLKRAYQSLKLIPCVGRVTIEAEGVDEREGEITEEEFRAQTGDWGTDLDVQYVRQMYRRHGWPGAFRKEEAAKAIGELVESMGERGEWEGESMLSHASLD
ncbi:hypothetical protein PT974_07039 [Cladobotryum mycophilum]|uniref:Uncharacterized protein n=1 Tax=Cladobotryum mycophilum TaxID=491253 RepID=A0ABR0SPC4_9HYPO